jgi:hypothetical protein
MKTIKFPGYENPHANIKNYTDLKRAMYDIAWCVQDGAFDLEYASEMLAEIALIYKKNTK